MVSAQVRVDPEWLQGNYLSPPKGWLHAYELMRLMIDGMLYLQITIPDQTAADQDIAATQERALTIDANDILYSLESSLDYNPEPHLDGIRTRLFGSELYGR